MGLFLLLWLLAIAIIFSMEFVAGIYWYQYIYDKTLISSAANLLQFQKKYSGYLDIYSWWFIFLLSFLTGIFTGWLTEKTSQFLSKVNLYWQKTQPEFYRNTSGEKRVLLSWLIIELPILLIVFINITLLIIFQSYTRPILAILFLTGGFIIGQLIEVIKEFTVILEQDRPEKPPTSIIQKISPAFPSNYSLILGQLYCRALLPLFFLYMAIFLPGWFLLIPNYNNTNLLTIFLSIIFGITIRWFYDSKNNFYFGRITLKNFLFTTLKLLVLITLIGFTLVKVPSLYLLALISLGSGFVIPWHPEKLRR